MAKKKGKGSHGGRRPGAGGPRRPYDRPKKIMNAMVPAGPRIDHDKKFADAEYIDPIDIDFAKKQEYIDPVDFCLAVINGDQEILSRVGLLEIPDLDQKLEAAKAVLPYTNKRKPAEVISKHQFSWMDEITEAENRVKGMRLDVTDDAPNTVN